MPIYNMGKDGEPYSLQIAKGDIPGTALFEKFGKIADIDIADPATDIWNGGGNYTGFPSEVETMEIRSSSAADTVAGTGARTVRISNLLDATGAEMPPITVNMNGTSWVSLGATTYWRGGTRIEVLTAGTGEENAGEITLRHTTTTANIFAVMPVGKNQTAIAAYTVPLGKTLYISRMNMQITRSNGANGAASMTFRARPSGGVFNTVVSPDVTNTQSYLFSSNGIYAFSALTDLKMRCESVTDDNSAVSTEFNGYLVDD